MAELDTYKIKVTVDNKEWKDAANQRANDRKVELNASKVATAQALANIKLETKATLDAMAEQKKARLDAAKQTVTQQRDQFGLSGDMSQITSFRELTLAIKNAKSGVLEFGAATKMVGSDKTYGQWLNELTDKKQVLRRAAGQTSEQMLAMSRDFSVVALTARNLIVDIGALTKGDKSFPELAAGIAGVGTQALIITPALLSVGKTFQAMGGSALFLGGSALPTVVSGLTAITVAYGVMASSVTHAGDSFGRLGKVLSGNMSYWEALKQNLKDNTFGLIDLTGATYDAANAFSFLRYQQNQFRTQETQLDINSKTLGKDIKEKYEQSSAALDVYVDKLKKRTASEYEAGVVLNKLQEISKTKTGEELADLNSRINFTQKYINELRNAGIEQPVSGRTGTTKTTKSAETEIKETTEQMVERINKEMQTRPIIIPVVLTSGIDVEAIKAGVKEEGIPLQNLQNQLEEQIKLKEESRQADIEAGKQFEESMIASVDYASAIVSILRDGSANAGQIFINLLQQALQLAIKIMAIQGLAAVPGLGIAAAVLGFIGGVFSSTKPSGMPSANFNPLNRPGDMLPPVMGLPSGHSGSGGALLLRLDMGEMGIYNFMKKGNELIQVRT